jgi:hypothetical protein
MSGSVSTDDGACRKGRGQPTAADPTVYGVVDGMRLSTSAGSRRISRCSPGYRHSINVEGTDFHDQDGYWTTMGPHRAQGGTHVLLSEALKAFRSDGEWID